MSEPNWQWWHSHDEENFYGPYESREAAIGELYGEAGYVCAAYQADLKLSNWVDVDRLIARAAEDFGDSELANPDGAVDIFSVTDDESADLERCIKAAIDEWQARHNLKWTSWAFAGQRNLEHVNFPAPSTARGDT